LYFARHRADAGQTAGKRQKEGNMTNAIDKGDMAPDFRLPTDGSGQFDLSALRGHPVIVFFYPKDDTSGCTLEAKDFTAMRPDFDALGAQIVGISPDNAASHDKFKAKHGLAVTLACDEDKDVLEAYGVWKEKSMYGRKYMGVERSTFLIDGEGRIARAWRKVKVPSHVEEVLAATREIAG
jgi:peroxiredoxin Q/BCP